MRRFALSLFFLCCPLLARAENNKYYFEYGEGYAISLDNNELRMSSALGLNVTVGYNFRRYLAFEGQYANYKDRQQSAGLLAIKLRQPREIFRPYVIGGLGMVNQEITGFGPAAKIGLGLNIMSLHYFPRVSLGLETSFINGFGKTEKISYINTGLVFAFHFK